MSVRRQRRRINPPESWKAVFWAAIVSGGMVAFAFLATWYFDGPAQ